MDQRITNKRVGLNDIIQIAEMMNWQFKYYKDLEAVEQKNEEAARARGDYFSSRYVYSNIKYTIKFNNNETLTKENEFDWFKETLYLNANIISDVSIYFTGTDEEKRESLTISFTPNRIYFDSSTTNMNDNQLANMVEAYINKLPPRFDKLVAEDTRRKVIPALNISIPLGIIVSFVLLILARLNVFSADIAKYLTTGIALTTIFVLIAFVGSLLIPTKNTDLYRHIKIETYYAGYNEKTYQSIRKNDYEEFKSNHIKNFIQKDFIQNFTKIDNFLYV